MPYPIATGAYMGGWHDVPIPTLTQEEEARIMEDQEAEGNALLHKTCELLQKNGLESSPILIRGDAASEIIDYADAENVDLIVAGSRGLSPFRSWLMGSVSRKLVHYSNCSVLIVRQPETE